MDFANSRTPNFWEEEFRFFFLRHEGENIRIRGVVYLGELEMEDLEFLGGQRRVGEKEVALTIQN